MNKILGRLKTDKDFRYDFFIALWSGIIIVAVVVALIFGVVYFSGKMNDENEKPKATETPAVSESPSPQPTPTATPGAGMDENEPDNTDDENSENGETGKDDNKEDSDDKSDGEDDKKDTSSSPDTVYATTTVNVRKDASSSSESLGKISEGTSVERIESLSNGWSKVNYKGKTAYIKSEFLTTKKSDSQTAAPQTSAPSTDKKRPKSTKAPAKTEKPSKTSKPKTTKEPEEDEDERTDTSEPEDSVKPTSVPPDSDNLTGTDIQSYQNAPAAKTDGASD